MTVWLKIDASLRSDTYTTTVYYVGGNIVSVAPDSYGTVPTYYLDYNGQTIGNVNESGPPGTPWGEYDPDIGAYGGAYLFSFPPGGGSPYVASGQIKSATSDSNAQIVVDGTLVTAEAIETVTGTEYYLDGRIAEVSTTTPSHVYGNLITVDLGVWHFFNDSGGAKGDPINVDSDPLGTFKYYDYVWIPIYDTWFTSSFETVNFNKLTSFQQSAVEGGADLYNALGGGDNITLPDANPGDTTIVIPGTNRTFDLTRNLFLGDHAGETTMVSGGSGSYNVALGAGHDIVDIEGDGNSHVVGGEGLGSVTFKGNGNDSIDVGTGEISATLLGGGQTTFNFTAQRETLDLFASSYTGSIQLSGLQLGDTIDLHNVFISKLDATAPTLTFFNPLLGSSSTIELNYEFSDQYSSSKAVIHAKFDGVDGTILTVDNGLFTAGDDTVDFGHLTYSEQRAVGNGADATHGLGGNDTVILSSSQSFTTGSKLGDLYTMMEGSGDYKLTGGDGIEFITINGSGTSSLVTGSGTEVLSISGGGRLVVNGSLTGGSATIGANSTLELKGTDSGSITFDPPNPSTGSGGTLQIDGTVMPTGPITGLSGNKIDLAATPLSSLAGMPASWSGDQLTISGIGGPASFQLPGAKSDLALFSDGQGHAEFTTFDFGSDVIKDAVKDAGIVKEATEALLASVTAIKSYQPGSPSLEEFEEVFGPFFTTVGTLITTLDVGSEATAIYQKFESAVDSPTATVEDIKDAWHEAFSEAVNVGVKQGLKAVLASASAVAAEAATETALAGIAGFAAEGAVGGYLSALAIGAGVLSAPVVVGVGAALAVGIAVDQYYGPVLKPIVDDWIEEMITPHADEVVGITQDGYISRATVFADDNGNGRLDSSEASSSTDSTGSFSLAGGTGPLIAFGGIDTSIGLPFKGHLSAPAGSGVITALTTLLTALGSDPSPQSKILSALGLPSTIDLTTFDPIAAAKTGSTDGAATEIAAAKVYDTVETIASALAGAGGAFDQSLQAAFSALAAALGGAGIDLSDKVALTVLIDQVAQADNVSLANGVAESVAATIAASNAALDQTELTFGAGDHLLNNVAAIERVIQGSASNAIQQAANDPGQLQALANAFTGANLDKAISTALSHLGNNADTTAPTLTPVADQTLEATSAAGAAVSFSATATDLMDGTDPVVFKEGNTVVHSGDLFTVGNHTIIASAIDAAGNSSSETFAISVVDMTAPTLTSVADQTLEASSASGAVASFMATATDLVDGTDPVVFKEGNTIVHSGDVFGLGVHTISASAIDAAGNVASENFVFKVVDTTAPILTLVADQTVHATSQKGAAATFSAAANDLVDGNDLVAFSEGNAVVHSGDIFALGTHTITAIAVDEAGNTATETFAIKITDEAPLVSTLVRSVGEDRPTFIQDLLAGASDPDLSDLLSVSGLDGSVTTAQGRHLVLGTDYTLNGSSLALTAAGFAKFNSLAGSQTDQVLFHYEVSDGVLTTADSLALTVVGANDAPTLVNQTANQSATAGTAFLLTIPSDTFQDPDTGDHLTLAATLSSGAALPSWLTFDAAKGILSGTPGGGNVGGLDIAITSSDTGGLTATDAFHLNVAAATNHAPIITSDGGGTTASIIITDRSKYVDTVHAADPDPNASIKYSIIGGQDQKLFVIDPTSGVLSFKSMPKDGHSYQVTVAASDGGLKDTQTIEVQIAKGLIEFGNAGVTDTFVFKPGFGLDIINKFDATSSSHDVLELDHALFWRADPHASSGAVFDLIERHSFQFGSDVIIATDTLDFIDLRHTDLHALTAKDFLLV